MGLLINADSSALSIWLDSVMITGWTCVRSWVPNSHENVSMKDERRLGMRRIYFLTPLTMLLFVLMALAQSNQGTITGRVTDPSGGVIPQVQVTVTNLDTRVVYPGVTNNVGIYSVLYLPVGRYGVEFKREGFKTFQQEGVTISTDQVVELDVTLGVGTVSQTVTVNANAAMLSPEQTTTETNVKAPDDRSLPHERVGCTLPLIHCFGDHSFADGMGGGRRHGRRDDRCPLHQRRWHH